MQARIKWWGKYLLLINGFFCFFLLMQGDTFAQGGKLYTAQNIWYEAGKETVLWCINYKTGFIIPAGTEVRNVKLVPSKGRRAVSEAIYFETVPDGKAYWINMVQKFHPGRTITDYKSYMFTSKNFGQLTKGFTASEIEAIKEGIIVIGMSKKAVLVSYGRPPEHRTRSLETSSSWVYWMNRFRTKTIFFDKNGKTTKPSRRTNQL